MNRTIVVLAIVLGQLASSFAAAAEVVNNATGDLTSSDIFAPTTIWTIHVRFSPDQGDAMEPNESGGRRRGFGRNWLLGPEGGRNGLSAAQGITFEYVRGDMEFGTTQFKDVGVRYKGNGTFWSSRDSLKRSLKVDFNQFVKRQKLAGMSQINLHNSIRDASGMNEAIAYRLFRDGGVPAPRTAYAKVYVTVPGKHDRRYFGLYNLVEDVGGAFVNEHFQASKESLLKPVTPNPFSDLGDDWKGYNQTYDPKGKLSDKEKQRIIEFCKFTSTASESEFGSKLGDYIDIDNLARYMAITVWLSDMDGILGPGQNYYVYLHPQSEKMIFIPWDQDQVFGQFPRGSQEERENLSIHKPWNGENRFLERVFGTEQFKNAYLSRMREFNDTIFQPARIAQQVDELVDVIRDSIADESDERYAELNNTIAEKQVTSSMGPGFNVPVSSIKPFVEARSHSVKRQLDGQAE
jgi:spore coat protein CotH